MRGFAETDLIEEIKNDLSLLLDSSSSRISCRNAARRVAQKSGRQTRQAALIIHQLVKAGFFRYVNDCGQSFLENNYTGVVRLSERIMIAPPGSRDLQSDDMVTIRIRPGAAFGDCRHPTTRLSVRAIDFALTDRVWRNRDKNALDIGTGSGILAITAAALGTKHVMAIDIDPCARKEARENVAENRLADRITICDQPVDKIAERFTLIIGNLRPPTLIRYAEQISEKTKQNGMAVLSGMKEEEKDMILAAYHKAFSCIWKTSENGWCVIVLQKRGKKW